MMDVNFLYKLYLKAVGKGDEDKKYREKRNLIDGWLKSNSYAENSNYFGDEMELATYLNEESIIVSLLDDNTRRLITLSIKSYENSNATPNKLIPLQLLAFCTGLLYDDSIINLINIDIIPIIAGFLYGKEEEEKKHVPPTGGGKKKKRKYKRKKSKKRKSKKRKKTKRR
jgi:hypothetical protein